MNNELKCRFPPHWEGMDRAREKTELVRKENSIFMDSLEPGMLFRPVTKNGMLFNSEQLLKLFDDNNRDFSDITLFELEKLLLKTKDSLVLINEYKNFNEAKDWFFLLSTSFQTVWTAGVYLEQYFPNPDSTEGYRFIESLWGETRVFVCYPTNRHKLIKNEIEFKT